MTSMYTTLLSNHTSKCKGFPEIRSKKINPAHFLCNAFNNSYQLDIPHHINVYYSQIVQHYRKQHITFFYYK